MQHVLFILPDEKHRLPGPDDLRRSGFRVSSAMGGKDPADESKPPEDRPARKADAPGGPDAEDTGR